MNLNSNDRYYIVHYNGVRSHLSDEELHIETCTRVVPPLQPIFVLLEIKNVHTRIKAMNMPCIGAGEF